jgi:hypothetical protein
MKKLSSDTLYYKGFIGFIIGPFLIILFVKYVMVNNVSDFIKECIYILLLVIIITQGRLMYKTRQAVFDDKKILLKWYFTKQSCDVLLSDVISLKKAFSLQKKANRNLYKLTYYNHNKIYSIYFFRDLDLAAVDNLYAFVGLDKINLSNQT